MNDREFERIFRDRLYDQSYPPRPQLWKQLRLRWRNRIAARQWRWFSSASVVVVVVMFVLSAGHAPEGVGVRRSGAQGAGPGARGAGGGAQGTGPGARGAGGGAQGTAVGAQGAGGGAGRSGVAERSGGAVGSGGVPGAGRVMRAGEVVSSRGDAFTGGTVRAGGTVSGGGAEGSAERVGGTLVTQVQPDGHWVKEGHQSMGVRLPGLAQVASRSGVQLPARAKAAHVGLPGRPKKDAAPVLNGWSAEVYGSPDLPTQQFNFSWTAGFRVSRIFATHFSITTGLQYSTVNVHRGDWASTVLYPPRFTNLDLPILLGYSTGGRRFRLSAYAGGYFNIISHPSGSPGWPWPNHGGPSAYFGLDFNYVIHDSWSLFVQPYGRCLFSNGSNSLFPSQLFTEGALIGFRYRLIQRP